MADYNHNDAIYDAGYDEGYREGYDDGFKAGAESAEHPVKGAKSNE